MIILTCQLTKNLTPFLKWTWAHSSKHTVYFCQACNSSWDRASHKQSLISSLKSWKSSSFLALKNRWCQSTSPSLLASTVKAQLHQSITYISMLGLKEKYFSHSKQSYRLKYQSVSPSFSPLMSISKSKPTQRPWYRLSSSSLLSHWANMKSTLSQQSQQLW